jgi:uncharacterized membrane protein
MNNRSKINMAFEILWISLGITCLIVSIRIIVLKEGPLLIFLALSALSFLMAGIRRKIRKSIKK